MVLNNLPRDPRHLRWFLGKHVNISPEEGDEHEFLFSIQITRDTGSLTSFSTDLNGLYGTSSLAEGCTWGAKTEPCWHELGGAGS
jgi:hypothetical protein